MEQFCKLVLAAVAFSTFTSVAMAQSRADLLTMNPEVRALVASIEKNRSVKCQTRLEETKQMKLLSRTWWSRLEAALKRDHFQLTDVSIADTKDFREQLNK
jgi:hypothetical protein